MKYELHEKSSILWKGRAFCAFVCVEQRVFLQVALLGVPLSSMAPGSRICVFLQRMMNMMGNTGTYSTYSCALAECPKNVEVKEHDRNLGGICVRGGGDLLHNNTCHKHVNN